MAKGKGPERCPTPWCGGYGYDMCGDPDCSSCVEILAERAKTGPQDLAWCDECCRVMPYIHERPKHPNLRARGAKLWEQVSAWARRQADALRGPPSPWRKDR
jgi:hypothetical protein